MRPAHYGEENRYRVNDSYKYVGNLYGLRNWVEYGLKQSKNELGWADFRVTDFSRIEKWWDSVMSAYLMVSLQSEEFKTLSNLPSPSVKAAKEQMKAHLGWRRRKGWKSTLDNLRLF